MLVRYLTAFYYFNPFQVYQPLSIWWYFWVVTICWVLISITTFYFKTSIFIKAFSVNFLIVMFGNVIDDTFFIPYRWGDNDMIFLVLGIYVTLGMLGYNAVKDNAKENIKPFDIAQVVILLFLTYISPYMRNSKIPGMFAYLEAISVFVFSMYCYYITVRYKNYKAMLAASIMLALTSNNLLDEFFYKPKEIQINETVYILLVFISGVVIYKYRYKKWLRSFFGV